MEDIERYTKIIAGLFDIGVAAAKALARGDTRRVEEILPAEFALEVTLRAGEEAARKKFEAGE